MKVFHGFDNLPHFRHGVATIGSFDGVHRGHYMLLSRVCELAAMCDGDSIVFTFEPHPRITLGRAEGLRLLNSKEEKLHLLEQAGVGNVVFIPFTREFSRLSAAEFVGVFIVGRAHVETLVVGYNHRFGSDCRSASEFLSDAGVKVETIERQLAEGDKVSSTVVRRSVAEGDLATAWRLLGHPYSVWGCVVEGGRLEISEREYKLLPPAGVYNARTEDDDEFAIEIGSDGSIFTGRAQSAEPVFIEILGKK